MQLQSTMGSHSTAFAPADLAAAGVKWLATPGVVVAALASALLRSWTRKKSPERSHGQRRDDAARNPEHAPRLTLEAQWARLTGAIHDGIDRRLRIQQLNSAAAIQIDAAEHALERLFEELSTVIPSVAPRKHAPLRVVAARPNSYDQSLAA